MISALSFALHQFLQGTLDACNPYWTVAYVIQSDVIRKATVRCVVYNGVLFLGSIILLQQALLPLVHYFGSAVLRLLNPWDEDPKLEALGLVGWIVDALVFAYYQVFLIVPLYTISILMNTIWYGKIGDAAYRLRHHKKADVAIAVTIGEAIYRALLVAFFIAETSLVYLCIPYVGGALSFLLVCWVNALYSFESAWALQGMDLRRRLAFIEQQWPYFLGFGTPIALASFFWSTFVGLAIFALFFPLCIIQATCSDYSQPAEVARAISASGQPQLPRLPIFRRSARCADAVLRFVNRLAGRGRERRQRQEQREQREDKQQQQQQPQQQAEAEAGHKRR